jgi:hypothetical protein
VNIIWGALRRVRPVKSFLRLWSLSQIGGRNRFEATLVPDCRLAQADVFIQLSNELDQLPCNKSGPNAVLTCEDAGRRRAKCSQLSAVARAQSDTAISHIVISRVERPAQRPARAPRRPGALRARGATRTKPEASVKEPARGHDLFVSYSRAELATTTFPRAVISELSRIRPPSISARRFHRGLRWA